MCKIRREASAMIKRSYLSSSFFANRRGRPRPGTFPMPPNRNIIKPKGVPPEIKHRLIETQDSFLRDTRRRRRNSSQPIVNQASLPLVDTRQQMPQRECVLFARLAKHNRQIPSALLRSAVLKIEPCQSGAEHGGSVLEVGCAGTNFRPGRASRTGGAESRAGLPL